MKQMLTPEIREVMEAVHYRPAVSLIVPLGAKINLTTELGYSLKTAADKVEKELLINYPGETGQLVIQKLRSVIRNLAIDPAKKSVAIFVSPVFQKVVYLDIAVEEKMIIDESFEIRDLIYSKKQLHKYLVLLLSGKESRIYLGNSSTFVRVVSNIPESVEAYKNDIPEKVTNFSDVSDRKEILMDKFLQHIDHSLDLILNEYKLPLFVLGTDRILGHFKKLTKHAGAIVEYISGNYEEASQPELLHLLEPHITNWKKVQQKNLLNQLEEAASKKKLATGIKEVWEEAVNNKGRLLVVEKNYMYAAQHGASETVLNKVTEPHSNISYLKDAVDDVIEKVLAGGGDVEFADEGSLKDYQHIALIQYY